MSGAINKLNNFVSDINISLEKLGFPIEEKEFIPHITIGRVSYPPKSTPDISTFLQAKYESIFISITRVRFMCSELFPNGPIYSILGTHFLATKGEKGVTNEK
jgi:2'-5' RNA ligase